MRVFGAMLLDAYRELNSRRLFWITLAISGSVVLAYGSIGFDETGVSFLFGLVHQENELFTSGTPISRAFYRSIFSDVFVSYWLSWVAVILALISTTTIFPDFIAGGAIDLVLSKPIGRVRLFAYRYLTSLLFVLLQVGLFCTGIFLCLGARVGDWEWRLFAAIPVVVLFYSYLYAVNVLVGTWTRSPLTALLVTMLFWSTLFGINLSEAMLSLAEKQLARQSEGSEERIAEIELSLGNLEPDPEQQVALRRMLEQDLTRERKLVEAAATIDAWHTRLRTIQWILPKTSETVALVGRWLTRDTDVDFTDFFFGNVALDEAGTPIVARMSGDREVMAEMQREYESVSAWSLIGSSLAFELVVLAAAGWIFVRRDY